MNLKNSNMAISFEPKNHSYVSIDGSNIQWISVTTLLEQLKQKFDPTIISKKSSKNSSGKWFGMTPEEIQKVWKEESDRACNLGTWYHDQREKDIISCATLRRYDKDLPVIHPIVNEQGVKIASSQKLIEGIYPEHMVYLKSIGICGQSDLIEVVDGVVHVLDYKSNKEIKLNSYVNWEGISQKMNHPISHLEDCNGIHYNLQLSIYMYMVLKHNPTLKPGNLVLHHVIFEEEGTNKYGYPIHKMTSTGEPIVKEIVPYNLPYLKDEVNAIMKWLSVNKEAIIKNKKK